MDSYPDLAGVATADLVEKIGGTGFQASYINWSRTMQLLRKNAPGWLPELVTGDLGILHNAPIGAFLLIRFRHLDGTVTPEVPQAIMDTRNAAIPLDKITARDISDTHRRGVCMAAALTFGLAFELWAKLPLESGFRAEAHAVAVAGGKPADDAWEQAESLGFSRVALEKIGRIALEYWEAEDVQGADEYLTRCTLPSEAKIAVATMFQAPFRTALKKLHASRKAA